MNRYATVTTRKGQFLVDLSKRDEGKLTVYRLDEGKLEPIFEIPYMSRQDVIKVVNRVVVYIEATQELGLVKGLRLLLSPEKLQAGPQQQSVVTPIPMKKGGAKITDGKNNKDSKRGRGRETVW